MSSLIDMVARPHQRTELVNALRAVLYEYDHIFPISLCYLKRIAVLLIICTIMD